MTPPKVSVLLTTYNGAPLLAETLDSLLAQRFTDFEVVIVDDASPDPHTPELLAEYAARDARLRVLRPAGNLGIVGARNFGFAACRGAYIATQDHDDLSAPDRLGMQAAHLDAHPDVVLVGSAVIELRPDGRRMIIADRQVADPLLLRWLLHVDNPFAWASVMLRRAAIAQLGSFLRPEFEYADDFELYHRLLRVGEAAKLPAPLASYRWHAQNTTHRVVETLSARAAQVLEAAYLPWLGADAPAAARLAIAHISDRRPPDTATLTRLGGYLERILAGFCDTYAPAPAQRAAVEAQAAILWWQLVRRSLRSGHPASLPALFARPALRRGPGPGFADLLVSGGVGAVRSLRP
jgi:Glycosyl transferase family 2